MNELESALHQARGYFDTGTTRSVEFRSKALRRMARTVEDHERDLLAALHADLRKPEQEAWASEIGVVLTDIAHALRNLSRWTRPRRRTVSWGLRPASARVHPEPLGVALILGPWNYPFQLLFSPLVGALAAGNCACLKPSEFAPAASKVMTDLVRETFEPGHVTVIEGGAEAAQSLVKLDFDHIFFTGSATVGRQVMAAAAKHLTPVTLELGGKCPCVVCPDARLDVAARRIAWGKFLNAGQTCVAPDHVFVHASVRDRFLSAMKESLIAFFGPDPRQSIDFGRIVNQRHFRRIQGYLVQGEVAFGGQTDADELYIAPTLLVDPAPSSAVMSDEIFGPVLPVLSYDDLDETLANLNSRPRPLAFYLFTEDREVQDRVLARTVSGGVGINDVINQIVAKELPFGGLGESGMGQYHGRAGFDCFTHYRSVLRRSTRFDAGLAYPPSRVTLRTLKRAYGLLFRK